VIEGGQTMNPSTEEIVAAVDATPATEVIVLPNNENVILSAEQAIGLANKPMRVLPTRSVQAGLAAMVVYDPEQDAGDNEIQMLRAEAGVVTGEVTIASRDVSLDGVDVRKGAWLGLADGAAVASDESFEVVAGAVIDHLLADGQEMLTLLTGEEEPEAAASYVRFVEKALGLPGPRRPRAFPRASPVTRSSCPTTTSMQSPRPSPGTAKGSQRFSSSLLRATWALFLPHRGSSRRSGCCATRAARCSFSTK
jgi:hypothetical protein